MNLDEKIVKRLDELVAMGHRVLETDSYSEEDLQTYVDSELFYQWATMVENILIRVFGKESVHYLNYKKYAQNPWYYVAAQMQGVVRAAHDDYKDGFLFEARQLIEAEVFDDMLEQGRHLLSKGYFQAAMVISGAVLEDTLRHLCDRNSLSVPDRPKLDTMNAELAKAGVYKRHTQKRITAIADLRNSAAHGKWQDLNKADVEDATKWIGEFIERHYA